MNNFQTFQQKISTIKLIFWQSFFYSLMTFGFGFIGLFYMFNRAYLKYLWKHRQQIKITNPILMQEIKSNFIIKEPLIIISIVSILLFIFLIYIFGKNPDKNKTQKDKEEFLKGSFIDDSNVNLIARNKEIKKNKDAKFCLKLNNKTRNKYLDYFCFRDNYTAKQGYLLLGKPGSGKTNLIRQILMAIIDCRENGVILDLKATDYLPYLYQQKTDIIFNPADSRSVAWNIFDEIENIADIETIVTSIIGEPASPEDRYWVENAQSVLYFILYYLKFTKKNEAKNEDIFEYASKTAEELVKMIETSEPNIKEQGLLALAPLRSGDRVAPVVLGFMASRLKPLKHLKSTAKPGQKQFRIADFISVKNQRIYINARKDVIDSVKSVISLFITLLIKKMLSNSTNFPTYFFLDEFNTLPAIAEISGLIDKGRSLNMIPVLGLQGYSQMKENYHNDHLSDMINSYISNRVYLSVEAESAEIISRNIGEQQVLINVESVNQNANTIQNQQNSISHSFTKQKTTQKTILASEIANFQNLEGLAKTPDDPAYFRLLFKYFNPLQAITPGFLLSETFKIFKEPEITLEDLKKRYNAQIPGSNAIEPVQEAGIPKEVIETVKNIDIQSIKKKIEPIIKEGPKPEPETKLIPETKEEEPKPELPEPELPNSDNIKFD